MRGKLLWVALALLIIPVVIASGCVRPSGEQATDETPVEETPTQEVPVPGEEGEDVEEMIVEPAEEPKTVTVEITENGFSPSTVTINSGDTVRFVNVDTSLHQPASNPHPIHTNVRGFDARRGLQQGETYEFTFTEVGEVGYHCHLHPSMMGTIIVE
jgi:plastocyanin